MERALNEPLEETKTRECESRFGRCIAELSFFVFTSAGVYDFPGRFEFAQGYLNSKGSKSITLLWAWVVGI